MRIRFLNIRRQPIAPQPQHKSVILHRINIHLHAGDGDGVQHFAERPAQLGGNAPGPAVGKQAVIVNGAKIAPRRHIARLQVNPDAQRFQRAPSDEILQRVVPEQRQMAGAAARRHANLHRSSQPAGAALRQRVQVGYARRFQLRLAGFGVRQTAQAVGHQQNDFGRRAGDAVVNLMQVNHSCSGDLCDACRGLLDRDFWPGICGTTASQK